jgi:hypothetical protein
VPPEAKHAGLGGTAPEAKARRRALGFAVKQALHATMEGVPAVEAAVTRRGGSGIVFADAEAPHGAVFETLRVAFGPRDHLFFVVRSDVLGAVPVMLRTATYEACGGGEPRHAGAGGGGLRVGCSADRWANAEPIIPVGEIVDSTWDPPGPIRCQSVAWFFGSLAHGTEDAERWNMRHPSRFAGVPVPATNPTLGRPQTTRLSRQSS